MNLRELARIANLSPSAVSLALRDSPKISVSTRDRVRKLAEQHSYQPDAKVIEVMRHLRKPRALRQQACFGVISFYDELRPWEKSRHLTRIYAGMQAKAAELGYRLEPLWLREPGMTLRRFESILAARGVEGLLCFGSPNVDQDYPAELQSQAVVTIGLSVRTPLHRVTSHFFNDTVHALDRMYTLGYRRPGLVVGRYEDIRSSHACTSAYLGWCEHRLGPGQALPIHLVDRVETEPLVRWIDLNQPDALLFVHLYDHVPELKRVLSKQGIRIPQELGVAVLTQLIGDGFSGVQQNQRLMGAWAIELLVARLAHRDLGIPKNPRVEMVESEWVEHGSLQPQVLVNG